LLALQMLRVLRTPHALPTRPTLQVQRRKVQGD